MTCDYPSFAEMSDAEQAAVIAEYAYLEQWRADRLADVRARAERFEANRYTPAMAGEARELIA